ncbi:MAG TPA: hypothetical protein VGJ28_00280 [Micromonosporaceae bacterium]
MNIDDVSRAASALDDVRESSRTGLRRWTLAGRLIARQLDDQSIVIRTEFDKRERLVRAHPQTFHVPPRFEAHMMVAVRLPDADPEAVAGALHAAWVLQTGS